MKESLNGPVQANRSDSTKPGIGIERKNIPAIKSVSYTHLMLSYYYLARIQENTKEYSKAIINLLKAEVSAKKINNYFYLGLICQMCIRDRHYRAKKESFIE